jgi:fucose permease
MLTSFPAASIFVHMSSFVQSKGFSSSEGAICVSFYGVGVLLGRFVWGWLVGRLRIHRSLIAYSFIYGVSIFLFVVPQSLPPIYATTVLLGIAIAGALQLNVQAFGDYFGRGIVGTLLGYAGGMAALTGATAPLIAAAMYDRTESYVLTFCVWGVFCLVASALFVFCRPEAPKGGKVTAEVALGT